MPGTVSGVGAKRTESLEAGWGGTSVTQPQLETEGSARKERAGCMESVYHGACELTNKWE